mgnify:CR=1 FL=1
MWPLIENYSELYREALSQLLWRYSEKYSGTQIPSAEFYSEHPVFAGGKNIFCALDEKGNLLAYAPLFPVPSDAESGLEIPYYIWTVIMVDPDVENQHLAKDLLLEKACQRAREIKDSLPRGKKVCLAVDCFFDYALEMVYFLGRGFSLIENRYQMVRFLCWPIPPKQLPSGIRLVKSTMDSQAEQRSYLKAHNQAFPESPKNLEVFQYSLWSDQKENNTINILALDNQEEIVGSITVVVTKKANRKKLGIIQDVFVLPKWRGKKIARCLMIEGLLYLRDNGVTETYLEVLTENERALNLYQDLGYTILNPRPVLGLWV